MRIYGGPWLVWTYLTTPPALHEKFKYRWSHVHVFYESRQYRRSPEILCRELEPCTGTSFLFTAQRVILRYSLSPQCHPSLFCPRSLRCAWTAVSREDKSYPGNCGKAQGWAEHWVVSDLPPRTVRRHRNRGLAESGLGVGHASHLDMETGEGTAKQQQQQPPQAFYVKHVIRF